MSIKIGINGFGRIGRLTLRAIYERKEFSEIEILHINDSAGDAETFAHLLNFDSVHGPSNLDAKDINGKIVIENDEICFTSHTDILETDWSGCDIVIDASGKFKTCESLRPYFHQGVKKVIVTAPIKEPGALNIVMGVNNQLYDRERYSIVTAASCTTNCIAPAVKIIHENLGIKHGSITTIHDITNTQTIIDAPHKDLRRARSCGTSLIPTTTGSATAIAEIFPELKGRLNGHAVRVPLTNASLTDCVFELDQPTSIKAVNTLFKQASENELFGILGYEDRPLVSVDFKTDARSCVLDALSTMIVNDTQLKLYLWYDNEWGYVNRTAELTQFVIDQGL